MEDMYPVFELAIGAMTFILGFAAARYHGHVGAARNLVNQLTAEFGQSPDGDAMSARDRLEHLEQLARSSLAEDDVAEVIVRGAWVWLAGTVVLLLVSLQQDLLGSGLASASKAVIVLILTALVTISASLDARALRSELLRMRTRTTVGLLATAAELLAQRDASGRVPTRAAQDALTHMQNAATRSPALSWTYAVRAQAHRALGDDDAAAADYARAFMLQPRLAAGLFDRLNRGAGLDLTPEAAHWFEIGHAEAPIEAERRLHSVVNGHLRRLLLGAGRLADPAEQEKIEELQQRVHRASRIESAHLELAARLWRRGDPLAAVNLLEHHPQQMWPLDALVLAASMRHQLGRSPDVSWNELIHRPAILAPANELLAVALAFQALAMADRGDVDAARTLLTDEASRLDEDFLVVLQRAALDRRPTSQSS